ncbi:hypothetical protein JTE90_004974 [Oedothorax gibbosus]|uniref:C2H2-type domain-containing protein n=1 Tax=Oedothorax gibbosus TaxID=931172 RepID=A0AAV6VHT6_9ARAC|nr:hypothetical protein JTE90_004974 [Oedothorax gibbosus]
MRFPFNQGLPITYPSEQLMAEARELQGGWASGLQGVPLMMGPPLQGGPTIPCHIGFDCGPAFNHRTSNVDHN